MQIISYQNDKNDNVLQKVREKVSSTFLLSERLWGTVCVCVFEVLLKFEYHKWITYGLKIIQWWALHVNNI